MLDIGWPELLVVAVVLIVVVGPKDLPRMLRTFGRTTSKMRSMAGDFRKQFDEALNEAELDDVKDIVDTARSLNPKNAIRRELASLDKIGRKMETDLKGAAEAPASASAGPAASETPEPAVPVKGSGSGENNSPAPAATAVKPADETAMKTKAAEEGRS
ncbi:Sec-independent protein translocase protein TatB [Notoacmeibacter sp. MSK16QG-6]|uniref:Sec-independent protein translocase protein TatB n=1 Tax=Notoacmeibacter sp. MSK16QG-6 TaxID=2957982 RepID=UPI0020A1B96E|nr:Sec-independent protein translocase protein TatB [Notoacmeibacter sp. MSK16QG-6]MCP1199389.1 Sec-independent protein translocase protein TatB [Notoacmeibacter sp. MSK16QG-6]